MGKAEGAQGVRDRYEEDCLLLMPACEGRGWAAAKKNNIKRPLSSSELDDDTFCKVYATLNSEAAKIHVPGILSLLALLVQKVQVLTPEALRARRSSSPCSSLIDSFLFLFRLAVSRRACQAPTATSRE